MTYPVDKSDDLPETNVLDEVKVASPTKNDPDTEAAAISKEVDEFGQ